MKPIFRICDKIPTCLDLFQMNNRTSKRKHIKYIWNKIWTNFVAFSTELFAARYSPFEDLYSIQKCTSFCLKMWKLVSFLLKINLDNINNIWQWRSKKMRPILLQSLILTQPLLKTEPCEIFRMISASCSFCLQKLLIVEISNISVNHYC